MTTIEQDHVYSVYNSISEHFSDTRFCIWNFVKKFLESMDTDMKGIDIGCGNGKNMLYRKDLNIIGYDNCFNFVKICRDKGLNVRQGNCMCIPTQASQFDFAMSIAVYHHMASDDHRFTAVSEMIRCLKSGGRGVFSVWSVENQGDEKIKRNFLGGDNYVKWMRQSDKKVYQRYYYVFTNDMIVKLMSKFSDRIEDLKIYNERGNWIVEFKKQ